MFTADLDPYIVIARAAVRIVAKAFHCDIDDLMQQATLELLQSVRKGTRQGTEGLVYTAARRACLKQATREKHYKQIPDDYDTQAKPIGSQIEATDTYDAIMGRLTEQQRFVLHSFYHGCSVGQIAKKLNISVQYVRTIRREALAAAKAIAQKICA